DLALAGADRLEEDEVLSGRIQHEQRLKRGFGEAAEVAAGAHRADEHLGVEEMVREADPVAEERPLRERARRVDRDHPDRALLLAHVADERADQARLADTALPGDPDRVGTPGLAIERADAGVGAPDRPLAERDRAL